MNTRLERRPVVVEVDSFDREKKEIRKNKMIIANPVGGAMRVTNGKFLCDITINEFSVTLKCFDEKGRFKIWSSDD